MMLNTLKICEVVARPHNLIDPKHQKRNKHNAEEFIDHRHAILDPCAARVVAIARRANNCEHPVHCKNINLIFAITTKRFCVLDHPR